ncbi:GNAT family N-acetyltransferase [Parerythrobacter jejuensis]|uniref:GNAT family N-acetyltransferase n=1 Tax=Parerythrobacter jejuensis TaxID=795812 RepID=A0A845B3Y5_9SPHN|nr:GNAT family N-acetyltransferase [Parerythrobacter jejuensis]MXP30918.1 GNAT family N-acetyltransferase [Parerythrobacter jejuensis]MXP33678.1 GNAT family N-acetyltransferase [Parerythrobacter jejuensis]
MADLVLETGRLVLRTIEESDAALQFRVLNSPIVMEHLGGVKELHEIEAKHAKSMSSFARDGFGFMMMIEKASGALVGHAGLKKVDHPAAPNQGDFEIGWLVREDRWRRGYAGEAMRAVIDWAFTRHDAPVLVALTAERNVPSWRLMEKLGMERRPDLDFDDPAFPPDDNPTIQYSLTREQWENSK